MTERTVRAAERGENWSLDRLRAEIGPVAVGIEDLRRRIRRCTVGADDDLRPDIVHERTEVLLHRLRPFTAEVPAGNSREIRRHVRDDGVLERIERVTDRLKVLLVRVAWNENELAVRDQALSTGMLRRINSLLPAPVSSS